MKGFFGFLPKSLLLGIERSDLFVNAVRKSMLSFFGHKAEI